MGLIDSANNTLARSATSRGWESISTEPSPAPVSANPQANNPWNRQASTRVNRRNQGRSRPSRDQRRPLIAAQAISTKPAGSKRKAATNQGPPLTINGAIAVMAVPHSAKGSTISNQRRSGAMGKEEDALFKIRGTAVAKDDLALAP